MRLPTPIYESLPYLYLVLGALVIGGVIYFGSESPGSGYFATIGVSSVIAGVVVLLRRKTARHKVQSTELDDC